MNTTTLSRKPLELHVEVNPEGEVTPTVPVSWTITEELAQNIVDSGYTNPYLLLIVASKHVETYGDNSVTRYNTTKVYAIDLKATPKAYVQFRKSGENAIIAAIVDLSSKNDVRTVDDWVRGVGLPLLYLDDAQKKLSEISSFYDITTSVVQHVTVPKELFAKKPPQFLRSLVTQFFRSYEVDQCHFRKRLIASVLMSIPIQLYGVLARIGTLLYGIFMLQRGMTVRSFFALNPHDFAYSLDDYGSAWHYDKNGNFHGKWWVFITPPYLFIYGVVLILSAVVFFVTTAVVLEVIYAGEPNFSFEEFMWTGVIVNSSWALVVLVLWLLLARKGQRFARSVYYKISTFFGKLSEPKVEATEQTKLSAEEVLLTQLRQRAQQGAKITNANDVKDDSIKLKFYGLKAQVCAPFDN